MKITILGSGTCVPSLDRRPCSILVQYQDLNILVDAGSGIMGQLLKAGVRINELDMILLSHFHLDHCAEVAPLLFALKYSGLKRHKPLTLSGGKGINGFYQQLNIAYNRTIEMDPSFFSILELEKAGCLALDLPVQITFQTMAHRPESRGFRFEDPSGYTVVYSGDTDVTDRLADLAANADILICESSFPDDLKVDGHLTPALAGEIAQKAGVKKLVLTHFYPECRNRDLERTAQKKFNGPVLLAKDLMTL